MTPERRRVAITGIGCVTPIGTGVEGLWTGLRAQRSAVRTLTRFDPSDWTSQIAAEIPSFEPRDFLTSKQVKRFDRYSQLSVAAARLALEDASLTEASLDRDRTGAMMGSALGGISFAESEAARYYAAGPRGVNPLLALSVFGGAASCNLAIEFGIAGPNSTNAMSCASGTVAIGDAFRWIRDGGADVMIAGGAEAPLSPLAFGAFALIRAMSTRNDDPATASRPFDRGRDGFVMGEGSAVVILERWDHAVARRARIYGEIIGYGLTNDAHHMTAPLPGGRQSSRAISNAIGDAGIDATTVSYVNAHGSSTPLNDPTETDALKCAFGDHAGALVISGTKGYYGHALGASGAIEVAITTLAVSRGWLPPTINLVDPDPRCDLGYVRETGTAATPEIALTHSFGFGGVNAALLIRRAVE